MPITGTMAAPAASGFMPQPPPPVGITGSAPLNIGLGGGVAGSLNASTFTLGGYDPGPNFIGGALTLAFNSFKTASWFDQHKWGTLSLVVIGVVLGVLVYVVIGHRDPVEGITRGCQIAVNSWGNWLGTKVAGLPGLPSAPDLSLPTSDQIGLKLAQTITPGILDMNKTLDDVNAGRMPG